MLATYTADFVREDRRRGVNFGTSDREEYVDALLAGNDVGLADRTDGAVMWLVPHFVGLEVAAIAVQLFQRRRGCAIYTKQSNAVFDAAVRRAGAVRVTTIGQLVAAADALAAKVRPRGDRLAIVTNGGGPGVMAADRAAAARGRAGATPTTRSGRGRPSA